MAHYLLQVSYSAAATKAMVERPQNREETVRKSIESLGGKMHSFHFCFGDYDAVLLVELPNNVAAAACALAVGARGAVSRFHTTVLMNSAEAMEAMQKAKTANYSPPQ